MIFVKTLFGGFLIGIGSHLKKINPKSSILTNEIKTSSSNLLIIMGSFYIFSDVINIIKIKNIQKE